MRYGMNPHQAARAVEGKLPVAVVNGEPSLINYLDALNAWQLVREAREAIGRPIAASFKHVSPAGVATAGVIDACMQESWGVSDVASDSLLSAYITARDADPKSSFGDMIAVSEPVDQPFADFVGRIVADGIIAPAFEPGAIDKLSSKKDGRFLVLQADLAYAPPEWEIREVFGMRFEQQRNIAPISPAVWNSADLGTAAAHDATLSLICLRYTQSNSVALFKDGLSIGIAAGQQNRVDCVRLAAAKARVWWLRRHPRVRALQTTQKITRQDRLNWQIRFAEGAMTSMQLREFASLFGDAAANEFTDTSWRGSWVNTLGDVTMGSDGFLPFRDNVDYAAEIGVKTIIEPGGSVRTPDVRAAAQELGITHIETGLRLFHH